MERRYKARTIELAEMMHASRPATICDTVRIRGDSSLRARACRLAEGFDLDDRLHRDRLLF